MGLIRLTGFTGFRGCWVDVGSFFFFFILFFRRGAGGPGGGGGELVGLQLESLEGLRVEGFWGGFRASG